MDTMIYQELTFEQAEEALTPEERSELACCLLNGTPLPKFMTAEKRAFYAGLNSYREYECECDIRKYILE